MARPFLWLIAIMILAIAGCRSADRDIRFAPPAVGSTTAVASPQIAAAQGARPPAPMMPGQREELPPGIVSNPPYVAGNGEEPPFDPSLLRPAAPTESVRITPIPGSDPYARPVDPRVYAGNSRATQRLAAEEAAILGVQGASSTGGVALDFNLGGDSRR